MRMTWVVASVLVWPGLALAHPGALDACGGHTATEWVAYDQLADGTINVPSEPGEYHFHFTPQQMDTEVVPSLLAYRRQARLEGRDPRDLGSFQAGGHVYDIWEYTRQGEAILHCQGDDAVTHTGIARIRVSE